MQFKYFIFLYFVDTLCYTSNSVGKYFNILSKIKKKKKNEESLTNSYEQYSQNFPWKQNRMRP